MLLMSKTKIYASLEMPVLSTSDDFDEGTGLILVAESGAGKVEPSGGQANEVFAGVALSTFKSPTTAPAVEEVTVPNTSPYTVELAHAPANPSASTVALIFSNGDVGTYDTVPESSLDFFVSGTTLTFYSADAGKSATIFYRWSLTVEQARVLFGDNFFAGTMGPSDATKTTGVIKQGIVFTSDFDTSANWLASGISDITLADGGLFARGGSGASVAGHVLQAPTADYPWLGLWINAA